MVSHVHEWMKTFLMFLIKGKTSYFYHVFYNGNTGVSLHKLANNPIRTRVIVISVTPHYILCCNSSIWTKCVGVSWGVWYLQIRERTISTDWSRTSVLAISVTTHCRPML